MTPGAAPADAILYTDPRLVAVYDGINAGDRDFTFYASRIGTARQRILDLGCGTGTFARRLASADWCRDWHRAPFDDAASAEIIAICRA